MAAKPKAKPKAEPKAEDKAEAPAMALLEYRISVQVPERYRGRFDAPVAEFVGQISNLVAGASVNLMVGGTGTEPRGTRKPDGES